MKRGTIELGMLFLFVVAVFGLIVTSAANGEVPPPKRCYEVDISITGEFGASWRPAKDLKVNGVICERAR